MVEKERLLIAFKNNQEPLEQPATEDLGVGRVVPLRIPPIHTGTARPALVTGNVSWAMDN